jgi:rhodanese-related sulfurtransferase
MKKFFHILASLALAFALTGVANAKKVSPEAVDGATSVSAAEAKALFDKGVLFVDVRSDKDWGAGRIPDAEHIELKKVYNEDSLGKVAKKGEEVVIYCNGPSCLRSSKACVQAVGWGYSKVYYFREGYPAWKAAGYPVE